MYEWQKHIQTIIDEIDDCIKKNTDEEMTLKYLSCKLGYSEFYISRKFNEISGMQFRDYLRYRRLAFTLKEVRDTDNGILDIVLKLGIGAIGMAKTTKDVKIYFVTIPSHKFLHIRNYESIGYWDFWQKQSLIPGQDCETICSLLDRIKGKLDDEGGNENNSGRGQIMAYINEPTGRICSWGISLAECYGVRLPIDYDGEVPSQMMLMDVPEAEYIVFEHGPFDYESENSSVEEKMEKAMKSYDYESSGYCLDLSPGRVFYFYHDPSRFWKYIRPVKRVNSSLVEDWF